MHIENLDVGLRKVMVAVFRSRGLSEQAADAKATANMKAADTYFHAQRVKADKTPGAEVRAPEVAMRAVAAWARELP